MNFFLENYWLKVTIIFTLSHNLTALDQITFYLCFEIRNIFVYFRIVSTKIQGQLFELNCCVKPALLKLLAKAFYTILRTLLKETLKMS